MGLEVGGGGTEEMEEEKEKIPLCESIGHRPLRGRCPALTLNYNHDLPKQGTGTADHLTLLRLFSFQSASDILAEMINLSSGRILLLMDFVFMKLISFRRW